MKRRILNKKILISMVLIPALTLLYSGVAFARDGRGGRGDGRGDGHADHGRYYYRSGRWHESGWFWGLFGTSLAIGTMVATLPPYYGTIYVGSVPYYYYDGIYYRIAPGGYVVVTAPAAGTFVTSPPVPEPAVTIVINVPNSSGNFTPVTLTKYKTGYLGPQGEYYEGNPTIEQLKALYGK